MKVQCPYCGGAAELVDSVEVYKVQTYGKIWLCRPCVAYVGVHRKSGAPLGTLADRETRRLRIELHALIDPPWKRKLVSRTEVYAVLRKELGMDEEDCHVSRWDAETCRRVKPIIECIDFQKEVRRMKVHYAKVDKHKGARFKPMLRRKLRMRQSDEN